jgi:S1/P1 Nuclease
MKPTTGRKSLAYLLATGLLVAFAPTRAAAWGKEGHAIVARIAAARLTPKTRTAVGKLLAVDPFFKQNCKQAKSVADKLACIASWADEVRAQRNNGALHFVDIPIFVPDAQRQYTAARDCPNGQCSVAAITSNMTLLRKSKARTVARAEALKYVVHFVGDLHQPLHNAFDHDADAALAENQPPHVPVTDKGDRGGNLKLVTWLGATTDPFGCWNLHAVWDDGMIEHKNPDQIAYAAALALTDQQFADFQTGTPVDWANDALALAIAHAYVLPAPDAQDKVCEVKRKVGSKSVTDCDAFTATLCQRSEVHARYQLDQSYNDANLPIVESQLQHAGARLAVLLNSVFDPTHH